MTGARRDLRLAPWTLPEVARITGVEYRTLHVWLRRGLFRASVRAETGTGHTNLFNNYDIAVVRWLKGLRDLGVGMEGLHTALERGDELIHALQMRPERAEADAALEADRPAGEDDEDDLECTHCGGEGVCMDGADPLGNCPDEAHPCHACGGSGNRRDQTIW